ncbi:hypothetical protein Taro_051715 [Colocasia esculenta]|uniref:Uncharacterized protein n=1 Tax=Colocasia esculenta TaxID=4460 RepID=A0A843XHN3_COLES|nr:hypothetical protein [Colocasia esculenta]
MTVMEVHMPERVWRQCGAPQVIPPAPERYDRKDGRGHARENYLLYHARNIERWNDRANTILEPPTQEEDQSQWRQWYGQQSNLYLTPFSEEPPTEYCPRGPIERALTSRRNVPHKKIVNNKSGSILFGCEERDLKLQEDILNKIRIKIPEYEQPSIPSGAEYTPGESSGARKQVDDLPLADLLPGRPPAPSAPPRKQVGQGQADVGFPLADLLTVRASSARSRPWPARQMRT